ncbi:arsenite efflux membrane protein ArsB [Friedmanniella luteola]|uniref:Arsenite efflux membrane protein ArsB n=1 Tax=Friedmanniella luteola TaxID=546871 RepID=A0A1H1TRM3_9ACTN|nr:SLC13 family permease [Friedmanniella luteola]SDS62868.1 arsenite efflux membrane protein ArsB [Friedmanniella luteola]
MDLGELAGRVGPILAFVVCITVVAELANALGVFAMLAAAAARLARGSVLALWLLVVLVAVVATAVLSLDTTAVLLTPVVLALAAQLGLDRELFALTAVWLANTASLLLPVSNLTNLLALGRLPGYDAGRFTTLTWPAALACVLITVGALALLFRRSLRGRYRPASTPPVADRRLLVLATVVCALLGPAFLLVDVVVASAVAAGVLVVACAVARPSLLRRRLLPWPLVLGVSALFVVVQYAHDHGLAELLTRAAGAGEGWTALLRVAVLGALGANLLDNLPSYLALEPAADGSPLRLAALLVGVNAGPLVTPWASLATLLWAARCRAAGVAVSWGRLALRGLLLVPVLMLGAVTALWLVHG